MRPQSPVPLTLEEHTELSQELRRIRLRLNELSAMIGGIYGPRNRAAFAFQRVTGELDRLCGEMDAQATVDLPGRQGGLYL
jgi:hypothetical protein